MQITHSDTITESTNKQQSILIEEKNREGVVVRRYKRGRFLGKGGFAKCYELTSLENNKKYAVKLIEKASITRTKAKEKLNSEIKIHRAMKSDYVVGFHHFFEDDHNVYIILELCSNQTLNELVKRRSRITEIEAKCYLHQIISGVKDIHNSNVIHRDLKLGNLFLNDKLEIKIGDFGLAAKLAFDSEKRKTMCGTPNYIAPEILENNGHSFSVDIWSIGVIAYAFVCGRPPFETNDVKTTYQKIKTCNFSFPNSINLSQSVKKFISKMLIRDPSRRATIDELLNEEFFTKTPFPKTLPNSLLSHPPHAAFIKQFYENDSKETHITSTESRANSTSKSNFERKDSKGFLLADRFEKETEKDSLGRVMVRAQSNERIDQRNHAIQRACSTNALMQKKKSFSKEQIPVSLQTQGHERGPLIWITYFESNPKFGVSYFLNSNATGMKFNDSTYMISNSNFTRLKYQSSSHPGRAAEVFDIGRAPESLNKKVKIIFHYQKELKKLKEEEECNMSNEQRIYQEKLRFKENNETALSVWVVKHQTTSKVNIFWFNNKDQQFIFKDHTEILISKDRYVTYVNKVSERKYFSILELNEQPEEIKKRMTYTNSLLQNMREQNALKNIENEPNRDNQPVLTRSSSMAKVEKPTQPILMRSSSTANRLQSYKNLR